MPCRLCQLQLGVTWESVLDSGHWTGSLSECELPLGDE